MIANDIVINHVTANRNADEGLEVDDSGSIEVSKSVFKNNTEAGLDLDDVAAIVVTNVSATHNGEHGLQIEAQDDVDSITVKISNSVFSNNVGDGIQIVEDGSATVDSVEISHVRANANRDIDEEDGGHGLFIDITGTVSLDKVTTNNNPKGNQVS